MYVFTIVLMFALVVFCYFDCICASLPNFSLLSIFFRSFLFVAVQYPYNVLRSSPCSPVKDPTEISGDDKNNSIVLFLS